MKTRLKSVVAGFVITGAVMTTSGARAQEVPRRDANKVSGSFAAGVATVPDYEGARHQAVIPLIAGEVRWGERYLAIEGTSARLNLLNSRHIEFGPVANLTFGRDAKAKPLSVRALGTIEDAFEAGAFAAIKAGSLLRDGDEIRLRIQGTRDVIDVHDGWTYQAALGYRLPVTGQILVSTEASVRFADDQYAATYFSVTPAGATASALPSYTANGGIKDVGASLTAVYALSDRWSLIGFGGYRRLVGDFKDSPIVRNAGRADQFSGGIGIGVRF